MKQFFVLLLILLGFSAFASASSTNLVRDVSCRQDGDKIVISYNLKKKADVDVFCSTDGGRTFKRIFRVSGDVGYGIAPGKKEVVWSVLEERDNLVGDVCFKVEATEIGQTAKSHNSSSYSGLLWNFYEMNGNFDLELVKAAVDVGGFWSVEASVLAFRYKMFELDWANFSMYGEDYSSEVYSFAYDPTVRLHIPVKSKWTIYAAAAPSIMFGTGSSYNDIHIVDDRFLSFKAEIGARCYSSSVASLDLFLRYKYQFGITVGVAVRLPGFESVLGKN